MKTYNQFYTTKISKYPGKPLQRILSSVLFFCFLASAAIVTAQDNKEVRSGGDNPVSKDAKRFYAGMKQILLSSAEKVPEKYYRFKPTDAVRNYGQIVGHLADSQFEMCSIALGEKYVERNIEKTKTSKADLIAALKEGFAYCDRAYDGMTDASAGQKVRFMGADTTKLGVLVANLTHSGLHYGNLITYMRMKKIVPPTSEPGFFDQPKE
ncbi:hypothetical protein BH20ACI1_BH20ACI1_09550 [soil metagenome]